MLQKLHISNYALISQIDISFREGLNIITGETGAGKSIILGALSLILGGRADMKAIRDTSKKTVIEAYFDTAGFESLKPLLVENDIDWDDDVFILRRELSPTGRSRAFINDTPVTLQLLRDVAMRLVDIHSQHQNLLLADHDYQLSIIDSIAENGPLLEQYAVAYQAYRVTLKKYTDTREMIMRSQADQEYLVFQLDQLSEMKLQPGEQEELEHQREVLANMSQIKDWLSGSLGALTAGERDAITSLGIALDCLRRLGGVYDEAESLSDRLESAILEVKDIAETLQDYDRGLNADPAQLDYIEERLSKIYTLEAKHHVDSSDQLIALRDQLAEQLAAISNADVQLEALQNEAKAAKKAATIVARQLSDRRKQCAEAFAEELRMRAMPLGMKNLRCEIAVEQGKLGPTGCDSVDFRFAFNKNQPLMSVGNSASGGEISRLILSIKLAIADKMQLPTIIFDEVDTGVSGDVAVRMGALMAQISHRAQVIAITHLPQVAAQGNVHYKVYKEDDDTATNTHIRQLEEEERVGELALMLSGNADDESARAAALSLLSKKNN